MKRADPAIQKPITLPVPRFEQPDDLTCGPTCLTQVYRYFGLNKTVHEVIDETPRNPDGGTLAVHLGISALRRGFRATIFSYNLRVFDPSWQELDNSSMIRKLDQRYRAVRSERQRRSLKAFSEYMTLGGQVRFDELEDELLINILAQDKPILTGLSATYLYQTKREYCNEYDDIRGQPVGHFVVICGYNPRDNHFVVRDPASHIPFSRTGKYSVSAHRLLTAILLGDVTYDAVLLVLEKG